MVPTCHKERIGVQQLERKKRHHNFDRKGSAVHKVTIKQIWVVLRRLPVELENVAQIEELDKMNDE